MVSAPLPADIVPCIAQPTTHELRSLGFLNKGFLSVGASVENSYVGRGQTLRVSIASRNDTSVDIGRVRVKLMELIEYKAQEEKETSKVELQKLKDIDHLPGLVKAHSPVGDVRRNILQGLGRSMEATYQSIFEDLVSGENQFDLVVPTHSRDSYNGNLITISHYLKITFITKALVENPSTKIPIVIGNPGNNPELQTSQATRRPNEPIATVIIDEEIPTQEERDDIDIVVGSRAEEFPMATAVLLNHQNSNRQSREHPTSTAPLFPYDEKHDEFNYDSNEPPSMLPPPVVPSAPPESLLRQVDNNVTDDASFESEVHNYLPSSFVAPHHAHSLPHQQSSYPPNDLYNTHPMRQRVESYTYDDTSVEESMRHRVDDSFSTCYTQDTGNEESSLHHYGGNQSESQHLRHPDEKWMLNRLIQELRGSIHDYEVVASKVGNFHYREIFKTLTAKEFGSLIAAISMSHQVKVALLLAKKNNRFMCEHCASAISKTSEYFRSNMAETLLPHCRDLGTNRHLVEDELNEWEQIVTNRSFEDCVRRRRRWV